MPPVLAPLFRRWDETTRLERAIWLGLLLGIVAASWIPAALDALSDPLSIQDDARDHVFWAQRYLDANLFPNDPIADYLESIAPVGYRALYRSAAALGIAPFDFAKLLPVFLALASAVLSFLTTLSIFPLPLAALASSLLVSQTLCLGDSLSSATPRAFAVPLLLLFLFAWIRRKTVLSAAALIAQAGFYPHMVLVSLVTAGLGLLQWRRNGKAEFRRVALIGAVGLACLSFYALKTDDFGPTLSRTQAATMPEFHEGGRSRFFHEDARKFWLTAQRSGFLPKLNDNSPLMWFGLALPILAARRLKTNGVSIDSGAAVELYRLLAASVALFALAHAMAFSLHNPSRYSQFSVFLVLNLAAGITLITLFHRMLSYDGETTVFKRGAMRLGVVALAAVLLFLPLWKRLKGGEFPNYQLRTGIDPELYAYLRKQPKNSLVASLSLQADFIPSLAQRSVLIAAEYALPYQLGYYRQFRQRALDLIRAQYSEDPRQLARFIQEYGVALWVLDRTRHEADYPADNWTAQYRSLLGGYVRLEPGRGAIERFIQSCTALETDYTVTLDARCILQSARGMH